MTKHTLCGYLPPISKIMKDLQSTAEVISTNSSGIFYDTPVLADQQEIIYFSSVWTLDAV